VEETMSGKAESSKVPLVDPKDAFLTEAFKTALADKCRPSAVKDFIASIATPTCIDTCLTDEWKAVITVTKHDETDA
jgi:hypothetical protein